jgi:putative FmdB family regulatory protein
MPLYPYTCTHGHRSEELAKVDQAPASMPCPHCGAEARRQVTTPYRTPFQWGPSAGYFDRGLGTYVEDHAHRRRLMAERGLRPVEADEVDRTFDHQVNTALEQDRQAETFGRVLRETGDAAAATEAAFPTPVP